MRPGASVVRAETGVVPPTAWSKSVAAGVLTARPPGPSTVPVNSTSPWALTVEEPPRATGPPAACVKVVPELSVAPVSVSVFAFSTRRVPAVTAAFVTAAACVWTSSVPPNAALPVTATRSPPVPVRIVRLVTRWPPAADCTVTVSLPSLAVVSIAALVTDQRPTRGVAGPDTISAGFPAVVVASGPSATNKVSSAVAKPTATPAKLVRSTSEVVSRPAKRIAASASTVTRPAKLPLVPEVVV